MDLFGSEFEVWVFGLDVSQNFISGPIFSIQGAQWHALVFVAIRAFRPQFYLTMRCGTYKNPSSGSVLDLAHKKMLYSADVMGSKPGS